MTAHAVPRCKECRRILAVLPGRWRVSRIAGDSERVPSTQGVIECGRCRTRNVVTTAPTRTELPQCA